ncbi:MAG: transglycosylase domain-containing protein [Actinomycetota bacterium]
MKRPLRSMGSWVSVTVSIGLLSSCSLGPVDLGKEKVLPLRSTVTASDGSFLTRLYRQNRVLISFDKLPQTLIDSVVVAEDQRFFDHEGFDLRAITRAMIVNTAKDEIVQGGSTITQQYVKNTFFRDPAKDFERKARELRLAIEIERRFSKEEILQRYLNTVYFGAGAYGIRAAAENYFGHGVGRLSLRESALLAALIKAPSASDPRQSPKRAKARRDYVMERMRTLGYIDDEAAERASSRGLGVTDAPPKLTTREPYFVEAVKREFLRDGRFGEDETARARLLWAGGVHVKTTLDPKLQSAAKAAIRRILGRRGDPAAALVSIRPATGEIVAMVGGDDWSRSQVNLAMGTAGGGSGRQPGSSFKPIALAAAMEQRIGLDTEFEAGPATFTFPDAQPWTVRNSEGTAGGTLPLDEALVRSVNGVFARLSLAVGPGQIVTQARSMGVKAKLPMVPSIALGSTEVSVLDMAAAYATIANQGIAVEPTSIKEVRLPNDAVILPRQKIEQGVMSPGNAYLLSRVMEQVIQRGTGRAADIGRPAAGKTGTTNDYADAWFVGFTPQLVTAVWVGHPEGRIPMTNVRGVRVTGGTYPAAIWREFMLDAHRGLPVKDFVVPRFEFTVVEIDPESGLLAAPWCPGKRKRMLRQLVPLEFCPPPPPSPIEEDPIPSPEPSEAKKKDGKGGGEGDGKARPEPSSDPKQEPKPSPSPSPSG